MCGSGKKSAKILRLKAKDSLSSKDSHHQLCIEWEWEVGGVLGVVVVGRREAAHHHNSQHSQIGRAHV